MTAEWHLLDHHGKLDRIYEDLEKLMAGQASIDAAVAAIDASAISLNNDVTALTAMLAAGQVNTDALDAALPPLAAEVNAVNALVVPPAA